jgi:hypothetical protein
MFALDKPAFCSTSEKLKSTINALSFKEKNLLHNMLYQHPHPHL